MGDVDGDSDVDWAVGNLVGPWSTSQNRLYFNLQRQLHAPVDLQVGQTYTFDAYLRHVQPSPITFALPSASFDPNAFAMLSPAARKP